MSKSVPVVIPGMFYLSLIMKVVTEEAFQKFIVNPKKKFFSSYDMMSEIFWALTGYYFPMSDLLTSHDEEGAIKRLNSYPEEIRKHLSNFEIPLHIACRHRLSDDFICQLIDMYPEGTTKQNCYGDTPLHHLCYQKVNTRLVEKFIRASDGGVVSIKNMQGNTPLAIQCLCPDSDIDVMRNLLLAEPSAVELDSNLVYLIDKILLHDKSDILKYAPYGISRAQIISAPVIKECWEKIRLLLRVSAMKYDAFEDDNININYVHSVVKLKSLFSSFLLKLVIELHPEDCCQTKNGQTTLSMAMDNSYIQMSSVQNIIKYYPDQINMIDPKSRLCPFMQAAAGEHSNIDIIYQLLSEAPEMLRIGSFESA